jgi:hypothetical protein
MMGQVDMMNNDFVMGHTQDTAERPTRATYSNYDKFAGQLFCYGSTTMSEFVEFCLRQCRMKRQRPEENVSSDADPLSIPQFIEPPPLDLHIDIEMKCPIELSPIENNFESLCNHIIEPIHPVLLHEAGHHCVALAYLNS